MKRMQSLVETFLRVGQVLILKNVIFALKGANHIVSIGYIFCGIG